MIAFIRRTLVGGLLTLLVAGTIGYLLWHAGSAIHAALAEVASLLRIETRFPALAALATLVVLAIAFGLLLQVRPVQSMIASGMAWLGARFPFSKLLHGLELELLGLGKSPVKAILVVLGNHEVLAFVMEELADGRCVVYAPSSPNPSHGSVYIVPRDAVRIIAATHYQVACCVSNWGAGVARVLEKDDASA